MAASEVHSQRSLNDLLNNVAQLNADDLELFVAQVLTLRAKRIAPGVSVQEAGILEKINQSLPPETQQRYDVLVGKRQAAILTDEEQQELNSLTERIELGDAERMQALIGLAQLRNVSVTTLMNALDIHPPAYG